MTCDETFTPLKTKLIENAIKFVTHKFSIESLQFNKPQLVLHAHLVLSNL